VLIDELTRKIWLTGILGLLAGVVLMFLLSRLFLRRPAAR
jgi:uncharacterized membrane-anchored protein YhcB (DUF1043 family)